MSRILEQTTVDSMMEEERKRVEHNARNRENLQKLIHMDASQWRREQAQAEREYPSIESYRPAHARREITFEDVLIPEEVQRETRAAVVERLKQSSPSPAANFSDSIYASPTYRQAAIARERGALATATEEEQLSMPTGTTLQYANSVAVAEKAQPYTEKVVFTAQQDDTAYLAAVLRKLAITFAVAFAVLMVVVTINSAILNGLDMQIISLQQELSALQAQAADLQQAIAQETSWESIWNFIQANGMVPMA